MLTFNDLLEKAGLDLKNVKLARHQKLTRFDRDDRACSHGRATEGRFGSRRDHAHPGPEVTPEPPGATRVHLQFGRPGRLDIRVPFASGLPGDLAHCNSPSCSTLVGIAGSVSAREIVHRAQK